ncbi:MAG: serpin family protein [Chloroflexi bacterium]|nr:serpin family protein [Chloroflexota bacterium]
MRRLLILTWVLILLAGCTPVTLPSQKTGGQGAQYVAAKVSRKRPGEEARAHVPDLVHGINAFATDFYRAGVRDNQENLVFSPYSIELAFSLAYAGAREDTAAQMQEVLHFLPPDTHHPAWGALGWYLSHMERPEGKEALRLHVANSVWVQQDYPLRETYLDILGRYYHVGLWKVDFIRDRERAREAINRWVQQETEGKIRELIPRGALDEMTRLVLANAIYFNGLWVHFFTGKEERPFTLVDGTPITVTMMTQKEIFPYAEGEDYQAVFLPYKLGTHVPNLLPGGESPGVEMLILLPAAGHLDEVEQRLSPEFLASLRSQAEEYLVTLKLPPFKFQSDPPLKHLLQDMGLNIPFDRKRANFQGISPRAEEFPLYISDAYHQATIDVNWRGTEAAAATGIVLIEVSGVVSDLQATMIVDRPFIFAIVERHTGVVLFMGRVMDPRGATSDG